MGGMSRQTGIPRRVALLGLAGVSAAALAGVLPAVAAARGLDTIEAIKTRRSVRRYTSRPLAEADLREILRCGMQAPSACDEQPWRFVILRDKALLARAGEINPYAAFAREAPAAVLVCGDLELDRCQGYWVQDCSNCAMCMLLAAHAMGLGAVWTGIYPLADRVEGFRALCGLPAHVTPLALLVIGHPAEQPAPENRFKPERIRYDRW